MIRKTTINDINEIIKLEKEELKTTLGELFLLEELENNLNSLYLTYDFNKEIIGYIGYRINDDNAEMMNFVFKKNYQNKGYGQELFDYSVQCLKKENVKTIVLEVRKSNTKAKRFYLKNEFKKIYVRKMYYDNEDALVYMKEV